MNAAQPLESFGRSDHAHHPDAARAALFQAVDRGNSGVGGGDHRRHHNRHALGEIGRRLEIVFDRDQRAGIAVEPDMRDPRGGNQIEHAVDQGEAGAQDRREHQLLAADLRRLDALQRRFDLDQVERQVARDLVAKQDAELAAQLAERFGREVLFAQQRQLVLHQRMTDDRDAFHHTLPLKTPCHR